MTDYGRRISRLYTPLSVGLTLLCLRPAPGACQGCSGVTEWHMNDCCGRCCLSDGRYINLYTAVNSTPVDRLETSYQRSGSGFPIFRRKPDMKYTKLGRTGLDVSRICLGCMSYGGGNSGFPQWSLGGEKGPPVLQKRAE